MDSAGSRADWVSGTAAAGTGLGALTMGLFPLAIPILTLTLVAMLPLVLPLVLLGALAALLAGGLLVIRAVARGIGHLRRGHGTRATGRLPRAEAPVRSGSQVPC
jgi:hypothetical protein